ncbi:MAG: hypothetical protein DME06_18345 [Candidatus Rokuibacteriota bacterium]|nr:MAG: hypothetical protein DME06_18345 [Candidatus Rokubacteria bacterium]
MTEDRGGRPAMKDRVLNIQRRAGRPAVSRSLDIARRAPAGPGRALYEQLFGQRWSVMGSSLALGAMNVFLFAFDRPWTASDGVRNWGDAFLHRVGVLDGGDLVSPWLYLGSLLNLGLLAGAFGAALLSREFAVRIAPAGELLKGGLGVRLQHRRILQRRVGPVALGPGHDGRPRDRRLRRSPLRAVGSGALAQA